MLALSVVMVRGGLQLAPINQSAAYFSQHTIVNHASLNTEWNLMHSVIENHFSNENPYRFLDENLAKYTLDSLYKNDVDSSISILKNKNANIVFIVLESYTSDVVEHFGGEAGVAPNLSKLAKEGISFKNIYASGDRTDKGLIAILSAFPSQAVRTIIQQPDKFEKLPSITKILSNKGYNTSFYYGGESEFANFKSYLITAGVQEIIDKNSFDKSQMNSKWGAHDGFLFDKVLKEFNKKKSPFASVVLTLSSHEPFEIPVASPYNGKDLPNQFRKAAHYTDQCLKNFFDKAKNETWYKNTLFVIVADHGHRLPKEYNTAYELKKFRIPLLFYGDVIKEEYKGLEFNTIGSQTDIASTLLKQLKINSDEFQWSKDLLNKQSKNFAFYSYDNGIGWVDEHNAYTMDNVTQQCTSRTDFDSLKDERMMNGKAYMQMVFSTYLAY
jgi:phosphoglycerol transferase MdoB-like AlkP superfamily enzyme